MFHWKDDNHISEFTGIQHRPSQP